MKYQAAEPKGKMMDLLRKCMIKRTETLTDPAIVDMVCKFFNKNFLAFGTSTLTLSFFKILLIS